MNDDGVRFAMTMKRGAWRRYYAPALRPDDAARQMAAAQSEEVSRADFGRFPTYFPISVDRFILWFALLMNAWSVAFEVASILDGEPIPLRLVAIVTNSIVFGWLLSYFKVTR